MKIWLNVTICIMVWIMALSSVVMAQTENVLRQSGIELANGEMSAAVITHTGITLAPTGAMRDYTSPDYTVMLYETDAIYTSTVLDVGAQVNWTGASFSHSGVFYDDFGEYHVALSVRTGYSATVDAQWSDWMDITPSLDIQTCGITDNPFQMTVGEDGVMNDMTIPGGRISCLATANTDAIRSNQYLQYRLTITTERDETAVIVNEIQFTYEAANITSHETIPITATAVSTMEMTAEMTAVTRFNILILNGMAVILLTVLTLNDVTRQTGSKSNCVERN